MERRAPAVGEQAMPSVFGRHAAQLLPDAVYRDLVATLFTMSAPILGFGILYALVGSLVYLAWPDQMVLVLVGLGAVVTLFRLIVIHGFHKAGGVSQAVSALKSWEKRYALLTYGFAGLVAAINLRVLATHQPLIHLATVSLIFTFGAGIVSRNAGRPRLCLIGQSIAVVPVAVGMLIHAAGNQAYQLHGQFFILEAILLTVVALMSIQSVRHLYSSAVEHLTAKHDLAKLARYDPLTGLANRLLLRDAFQKAILACRGGNQIAIHCLDLDGFKSINDKFGHPTGDRLLVEVARRLTATVRSDDIIVRLGGDEFLILQTAIQHSDQADLLARRIVRHLSEPYLIDDMQMRVSVSIGIALAPTHGRDLDGLMQCADRALYRSKAGGKAQIHFCDETGIGQPGRAVA